MTAAPRASKRAAPCVDWHRAARLLAYGDSVAVVAQQVGCSPGQLARKRKHDAAFRAQIEEYARMGPDERLAWLRETVRRKIEDEVANGTVRVLLWLADRLKLLTPPDERTSSDELRALLDSLSPEELQEFQRLGEGAEAD